MINPRYKLCMNLSLKIKGSRKSMIRQNPKKNSMKKDFNYKCRKILLKITQRKIKLIKFNLRNNTLWK